MQPINENPPNPRNGSAPDTPNMWVTDDYIYALVVQLDWRIRVWQQNRQTQVWSSFDISDTVIGIGVEQDGHNGVSMAVDSLGHIHIMGNAHAERLRYIRSSDPHDITSWGVGVMPSTFAKYFTNIVPNPRPFSDLTGWASANDSLYPIAHSSASWVSALEGFVYTTNTSTVSPVLGAVYIGGDDMQISVTAGQNYSGVVAAAPSRSDCSVEMRFIWRQGTTEIGTTVSDQVDVTSVYGVARPQIRDAIAPAGADNLLVEVRGFMTAGSNVPTTGNVLRVGQIALFVGESPKYIRYFDGDYGNIAYDQLSPEVTKFNSEWIGAPHDSASVSSIRAFDSAGADSCTYFAFEAFSDGTLLLVMAQGEQSGSPLGRGNSMWRLPAGETDWEPCVGSGEIMVTPDAEDGNLYDDDEIPDRGYRMSIHVDRFDVLHMTMVWRLYNAASAGPDPTSHADSMAEVFYVRSRDRGSTWVNVTDEHVDAPFTWRKTLDGDVNSASAKVLVGGNAQPCVTAGNMAVDRYGHIHFTGSGGGKFHVWWDGSTWQKESLDGVISEGLSYSVTPSLAYINGDIWLFGLVSFGKWIGTVWGTNWSKGTTAFVPVAQAHTGTLEAAYQFQSAGQFSPSVTFGGGKEGGRYVTRIMIPDGNTPMIFTMGAGSRFRVVIAEDEG